MLTDSQLVEQARRGDSRAYEELVKRNQDRVFHYALYSLPSWHDAEDVAQDTFVEAYRYLGRYRGDASFSTWVLSIARSKVALWYRRRKPEDPTDEIHAAARPDFESTLLLQIDTRRAVTALPPAYREVIVLRYVCQLDVKDIARILGESVNALSVRLHRARGVLRTMLDSAHSEEGCCSEL